MARANASSFANESKQKRRLLDAETWNREMPKPPAEQGVAILVLFSL